MKKNILFILNICMMCFTSMGQNIGINDTGSSPDPSAVLDVNAADKGLLIPRISLNSISDDTTINSPAVSLLVYNTNAGISGSGADGEGFYFWDGTNWVKLMIQGSAVPSDDSWSLEGNQGTDENVHYIGTRDSKPLIFKVNSQFSGILDPSYHNTGLGFNALGNYPNISQANTAIGNQVMSWSTMGEGNTGIGSDVLVFNNANYNTAIGFASMKFYSFNNSGIPYDANNTAVGAYSLTLTDPSAVDNGVRNTAIGHSAAAGNVTGFDNVAMGVKSLYNSNTGTKNISIGNYSLYSHVNPHELLAIGDSAMHHYIGNGTELAIGNKALFNDIYGSHNLAIGKEAMYSLKGDVQNVAVGHEAMKEVSGSYNTVMGYQALRGDGVNFTLASDNTAIGYRVLSNAINVPKYNTVIGGNAMRSCKTCENNTVVGGEALSKGEVQYNNTAIGYFAGFNKSGTNNTFIGHESGSSSALVHEVVTLGKLADVSGENIFNAMALGAYAVVNQSNKVRIGNSVVTVIEGQVDFSTPSDGRFKSNVQPLQSGLDFIMKLKPVKYEFETLKFVEFIGENINPDIEYTNKTQYGFIAQDVEIAAQEVGEKFDFIKTPQHDGDNYGLSYSGFVVPMIKAMQEQQEMIEQLQREIEILKRQLNK